MKEETPAPEAEVAKPGTDIWEVVFFFPPHTAASSNVNTTKWECFLQGSLKMFHKSEYAPKS